MIKERNMEVEMKRVTYPLKSQMNSADAGQLPPADPVQDASFPVFGRLLQTNGPPLAGVAVRALHKTLRGEIPLGEPDLPDDLGRYAIRNLPPYGVEQVDLIVRAVEPGTNDQLAG